MTSSSHQLRTASTRRDEMAKRKQIRTPHRSRERDAEASPPNDRKKSRGRQRLSIAVLLVAAIAAGWVLRVMPEQCIHKAEVAIETWQFEKAKQHLLDYPSWGTNAGSVYFMRARIDRLQAGPVHAMKHLQVARQLKYDRDAIAREQAFMIMQGGGLSPRWKDQLDEFLKQAPDDHPAIYEVFANALFHAGNANDALELLDRWSREDSGDGRPLYWKGWMLQQRGDTDSALTMYAESTKRNPLFVQSYIAQATIWSSRHAHEQAKIAYRKAIEIAPERLEHRIALGKTLWKMHRKSEAADLLQPIVDQHPTVYPCGHRVALYHAEQRDFEKVIVTLQPMMRHFPDDASLNYLLAAAYQGAGKPVQARAAMKKFLVANENIDRVRSSRYDVPFGDQYEEALRRAMAYRRYDWKQSLTWLNRAADSQPDNPQPHVLLSRHYRELGSDGEAVRHQNIADSMARAR